MAAPSFVTEAENGWGRGAGTTLTTPSFDALNGDVLVAIAGNEGSGGALSISNNGAALTWTSQRNVAGNTRTVIWTTVLTVDRSGLTVTLTTTASGQGRGINVLVFRGSDGIGNSNQASGLSTPSLSLTTTQNNSAIVAIDTDWNAASGTPTWNTSSAGSFTQQSSFFNGAIYGAYGGYYSDAGTAGAKTVAMTAPTGQDCAFAAVEVKGSAGGGGVTPPRLLGSLGVGT